VFFLSNLVLALAKLLQLVLEVYFWIIIARAILSCLCPVPFNPVVPFLSRVPEPVLRPIRYRLPTVATGLDLSPVVVLLVIKLVEWSVVDSLRDFGLSLR